MLCVKMSPTAFAKSIDSCQPAQSAQAYKSRNFSLNLNFLQDKEPFYPKNQSVVEKLGFYGCVGDEFLGVMGQGGALSHVLQ